MKSSKEAFDLIVAEEVTSKEVYERKYRRPTWPGVQSGPTVGIGYDLGMTPAAMIRDDWTGLVSHAALVAMMSCSGATGEAGKLKTRAVRDRIEVPWETALTVHRNSVLPRWEATVESALPNTGKLTDHCFGALVSLTFNRGPSFNKRGERYNEMRAIKHHMIAQNFAAIPGEIRAMKRLWPGVTGLLRRRDNEAALFEVGLGLRQTVTSPPVAIDDKTTTLDLQRALNLIGYTPPLIEDGVAGPKTKEAIKWFQIVHGRGIQADGLFGELTERELDRVLIERRIVL